MSRKKPEPRVQGMSELSLDWVLYLVMVITISYIALEHQASAGLWKGILVL